MFLFDKVKVGDILLIKFGEKIFVDGKVIKGDIFIDEFMLIGEFIFVEKSSGDLVIGFIMNKNGLIMIEVI